MDATIPRETLVCAAEAIQAAHDYVEVNGFDIDVYNPAESTQRTAKQAPCCYIGTLRIVAGLDPEPTGLYDRDGGDTTAGNDMLRTALEAMDKAAARTAFTRNNHIVAATKAEYGSDYPAGRLVENLGLEMDSQGVSTTDQKSYALTILRRALRDIHKDLA